VCCAPVGPMTTTALATEQGFARIHAPETAETTHLGHKFPSIDQAYAQLQVAFASGKTLPYEWRVSQLQGIMNICRNHTNEIVEAISKDLGRPKQDVLVAEVFGALTECQFAIANLTKWMQPQRVSHPMLHQPGKSMIMKQPKGLVLVITPWNFPINLSLISLVAVIAAGNAVLLKPSEVVSNCEHLLAELVPRYLDREAVQVITGGVAETTALLRLRWDHIFYTGNGAVARSVMRAAAENLTPITLELGGKSPTVVLDDANLDVAARRILYGKNLNSGQICVSPDYVLVLRSVEKKLQAKFKDVLQEWFGGDGQKSASTSRIVNERHFDRVQSLLDSGGEVVAQAGKPDRASKFMPITLISNPPPNSAVMREEIFGPLLPILAFDSVDEIISYINTGEPPLAMYVFGQEGAVVDKLLQHTKSGGVCVNDVIFHLGSPHLPFGGIGPSGMGAYHGKWGFDEFSHARSVMYRATWMDPKQRYPPYEDKNLALVEKLVHGTLIPPGVKSGAAAVAAAAAAAGGWKLLRSRL